MTDEFKDIRDEDYPDNSNENDETEPRKMSTNRPPAPLRPLRVESVDGKPTSSLKPITKAVKRKKNWIQRFGETFLGSDTGTVGQYIVWDVLIPAAKDLVVDMVVGGIEMLVRGDRSRRSSSGGRRSHDDRTYVEYASYSKGRDRDDRGDRRIRASARVRYSFDDYVIRSRNEASDVLDKMVDVIDQYGFCTVYELFDLLDQPKTYADQAWGWKNLSRASVGRVRDGYILDLPDPKELD